MKHVFMFLASFHFRIIQFAYTQSVNNCDDQRNNFFWKRTHVDMKIQSSQ